MVPSQMDLLGKPNAQLLIKNTIRLATQRTTKAQRAGKLLLCSHDHESV